MQMLFVRYICFKAFQLKGYMSHNIFVKLSYTDKSVSVDALFEV